MAVNIGEDSAAVVVGNNIRDPGAIGIQVSGSAPVVWASRTRIGRPRSGCSSAMQASRRPTPTSAGPDRTGCIRSGACKVGCRHNAKNTLDRNYLYLAEQTGAQVFAERQVVDVTASDVGRYSDAASRPGLRRGKNPLRIHAQHVVFSAGVLGTVGLLAALKETGSLPNLSDRLGELVRTNSESIPGAAAPGSSDTDYSTGIAISSSIYPDAQTHIGRVGYPKGSNAMALLATHMVLGGGRLPRQVRFLIEIVHHRIRFLRSLSVRWWSVRSVILFVKRSRDNSINLRWRRRGNGVRLRSEQGPGESNPTYIPEAQTAAHHAADHMGGAAFGSGNEALLNVPVTAHILGGYVIGATTDEGVTHGYERVFGHSGLHVADGSAISANLGVNPSLTIAAQTERAMAMWPNRGEPDERPPLADPYRAIPPTPPNDPTE